MEIICIFTILAFRVTQDNVLMGHLFMYDERIGSYDHLHFPTATNAVLLLFLLLPMPVGT